MPTIIKNQPTSAEIRKRLADKGETIAVSYSLGKDAIATTLALLDAGCDVELVYFYPIPDMEFVSDTIETQERLLGKTIHQYPHPSLWRCLNNLIFQPPERCAIIEAARMPRISYDIMWNLVKEDLGLSESTWVADGVRAADSIVRRTSMSNHGVMKEASRKVSPICDWLKKEVMACIDKHSFPLPVDYKWFGRSFDGLDYRFLAPLKKHAPKDYQKVLDWFPLADLELMRYGMLQERSAV